MNTRSILLLSVSLNVALAATLMALRSRPPATRALKPVATIVMRVVTNEAVSAPVADAPGVPAAEAFHWRIIESQDLRQFAANLRSIGCPEKVLRDLVLAEVDRQAKFTPQFEEVSYQPWHGRDRREADRRARDERMTAVVQEKRALIWELLGYDWDRELSELWDREPSLIVALGFLSDAKAQQIMTLVGWKMETAGRALGHSGGIVIDDDYEMFRKVRSDIGIELARILTPTELDELEARGQLGLVFGEMLHLDGMEINGFQFREIMLASRSYKDFLSQGPMWRDRRPQPDAASKLAEFERVIAAKLGPVRLAEFKRAQDGDFRNTFEFTKKQKLPKEAAIKVYNTRRSAEQQAAEIRTDTSLSAEEKATALRFLQETTAASVTSALGRVATNYFRGPGRWLDGLTATSAKKSTPSKGGQ